MTTEATAAAGDHAPKSPGHLQRIRARMISRRDDYADVFKSKTRLACVGLLLLGLPLSAVMTLKYRTSDLDPWRACPDKSLATRTYQLTRTDKDGIVDPEYDAVGKLFAFCGLSDWITGLWIVFAVLGTIGFSALAILVKKNWGKNNDMEEEDAMGDNGAATAAPSERKEQELTVIADTVQGNQLAEM